MLRAISAAPPSVRDVDVGEQVVRAGLGRGLGRLDRGVDGRGYLAVDLVELLGGELARFGDPGAEHLEAVEVLPGVLDLVGPVELLVALEVAEVAGELD